MLAPPTLQQTPLTARRAGSARWVTGWLIVPVLAIALPAGSATSSADTALDGARSRSHSRTVVIRVGICGAGARCEERVWRRTGIAPGPGAGGTLKRSWVFGSSGASGVITDTVLHGSRAGGARAEEVGSATCRGAVGRTDDREGVAEDVADVEVAAWVRFEDRAVGVGVAVGAHVGYSNLPVEARPEICTAGCGTGVGAAVEGVVCTLGVAGPGDGETVRLTVACSARDGKDAEGCC